MLWVFVVARLAAGTPNGRGCVDKAARKLPYCDASLSVEARVRDLSSRLTLEELIPRLQSGSVSPAVERLGLPAQNYRIEANHGLEAYCLSRGDGTAACPTYFPIAQGVAATFNRSVFRDLGRVVGEEARIWGNLGGLGKGRKPVGPSVRCPMVNLMRDPRWGRSDEAASEDPFLTAEFGRHVVEGLQAEDADGFVLASSEVKHFAAYTLETNWKHKEDGRKGYSANVTAYDWAASYIVPFRATLGDAGAHSYMCSYNAINGTPSCANAELSALARGRWRLPGFVESDCDAVGDLVDTYGVAKDAAEASALALNAGTDLDCGDTFGDGLAAAVHARRTSLARLREAFERAMVPLFLAGLFEPEATAWDALTADGEGAARRAAAARSARDQSLVLLKNDRETLPFRRGATVALVGPVAEAREQLVGPITIGPCPNSTTGAGLVGGGYKEDYSCVPTLAEALAASGYAARVLVEAGVVNFTSPDEALIHRAVAAAEAADVVVLALGAGLETVDEKEDLYDLGLPGAQEALAKAVAKVGKPTAAVLVMGNQYAIDAWVDDVPAVVDAFVPSGAAAADVVVATLFGANDRFGKLPYTLYARDYAHEVPLADASFRKRGYRYYAGKHVTFPFGSGLAYATFTLADARPSALAFGAARGARRVSVDVSSARGGDEVVQLYVRPRDVDGAFRPPIAKLVDFARVRVPPDDEAVTVSFDVQAAAFDLVDAAGASRAFPGSYDLLITNGNTENLIIPVTVVAS